MPYFISKLKKYPAAKFMLIQFGAPLIPINRANIHPERPKIDFYVCHGLNWTYL